LRPSAAPSASSATSKIWEAFCENA
jgi:hypothetical protein